MNNIPDQQRQTEDPSEQNRSGQPRAAEVEQSIMRHSTNSLLRGGGVNIPEQLEICERESTGMIDTLSQALRHAEWQYSMIGARLEGVENIRRRQFSSEHGSHDREDPAYTRAYERTLEIVNGATAQHGEILSLLRTAGNSGELLQLFHRLVRARPEVWSEALPYLIESYDWPLRDYVSAGEASPYMRQLNWTVTVSNITSRLWEEDDLQLTPELRLLSLRQLYERAFRDVGSVCRRFHLYAFSGGCTRFIDRFQENRFNGRFYNLPAIEPGDFSITEEIRNLYVLSRAVHLHRDMHSDFWWR